MSKKTITNLLIASMLVGVPLVAAAEPAPKAAISESVSDSKSATVSDEARYAALEKQTPDAAKFEGGGNGVYIGGGALTVVLIILLIVIIL